MKTTRDSIIYENCKHCGVPGDIVSTENLTHRHVCKNCGETTTTVSSSASLCRDHCSFEAVKLVEYLRAFGIRAKVNITFFDLDTKEIISTNATCPKE